MKPEEKDPRKKMEQPAEEQQLEQHNSVDKDSKETAQVIEDDKMKEEEKEADKNVTTKNSAEEKSEILGDRDLGKVTNKDSDTVNKKGQ